MIPLPCQLGNLMLWKEGMVMKKNLGVVQAVYPMPVLIVAAYDENGKVNAMNAAWGMICNSGPDCAVH